MSLQTLGTMLSCNVGQIPSRFYHQILFMYEHLPFFGHSSNYSFLTRKQLYLLFSAVKQKECSHDNFLLHFLIKARPCRCHNH